MTRVEYAFITFPDESLSCEAQQLLAETFDIAVNTCGIAPDDLVAAFLASGLDAQFERLNPVHVAGKSALDLIETMAPFLDEDIDVPAAATTVPLIDYWVGWVVAYYQQETGTPFRRIFEAVPYDEIARSYHPLHEADESKFVEVFGPRIRDQDSPTRLAVQRRIAGLSQSQLAERSDVSLRSIQMYEQKNKNINRASAETVLRLSRALSCPIEDLMEL